MEHRCFKRTAVEVEVILYCCGGVAGRGKIRNVSPDGMFIECAPTVCAAHVCVEVGFVAYRKSAMDGLRMRAYVIHRANEGIGVMRVTGTECERVHIIDLRRSFVEQVGPDMRPRAVRVGRSAG